MVLDCFPRSDTQPQPCFVLSQIYLRPNDFSRSHRGTAFNIRRRACPPYTATNAAIWNWRDELTTADGGSRCCRWCGSGEEWSHQFGWPCAGHHHLQVSSDRGFVASLLACWTVNPMAKVQLMVEVRWGTLGVLPGQHLHRPFSANLAQHKGRWFTFLHSTNRSCWLPCTAQQKLFAYVRDPVTTFQQEKALLNIMLTRLVNEVPSSALPSLSKVFSFPKYLQVQLCEVAWWSGQSWPHRASSWLVSWWRCSPVVSHCFRRDSSNLQKVKKGKNSLRMGLMPNLCWHQRILLDPADSSYKNRNKEGDMFLLIAKAFSWRGQMMDSLGLY